ncbi:MAG: hypothetical protein JXR96_22770 [Deltaproteobacteria bacterium]|nr:hypothetical protein [Deltaproteobacteria bacterium]
MSTSGSQAVTDGTFEAPLCVPLDEIGRMIRLGGEPDATSSPVSEKEGTTAIGSEKSQRVPPIVFGTPRIEPQGHFDVLQQYEGVVLSAGRDTFWARLTNTTCPEADEEEGEFPLEEVSEDDRWLVKPGAIFYWYIGYHDSADRQRKRQSIIRFRRLPAYTSEDISRAREIAKELMETFLRAERDDELSTE